VGGGPLRQSQSFFFLVIVGAGLGDLWVRGRTSGERSGFFCSGLFIHIFIHPPPLERMDIDLLVEVEVKPLIRFWTGW